MLRKFKDIHKGQTCIVMGNGPSLRNIPRLLLDKYPSFGANKIFLLQDIDGFSGFVPDYYTIIDRDMLHDCTEVLASGYKPAESFLPRGVPIPGSNQIPIAIAAKFSADINEVVYMGGTVTFANLQIAYYMGFSVALLVGVDHNYVKYNGKPSTKFIAHGEDPDHFHPDYFKAGRMYNTWERDGTVMTYTMARNVWEADGRRIVNLTPGSCLDVFERGEIEPWLSP